MEVKQVARPQENEVVAIDVVVLSEEEEVTENEKEEEKEKETDVLKITETEEPSSRPEWTKLLECPICLSTCQDPAMLDVCYHTFCFLCILQWVELSPKCPLCKRGFDTILHDLRQEEGAPMEYKRFKPSPSPSPSSAAARSSMEARRRSRRQRVTPKRSLGDEEERERQRKQRKRVYYQQQLQQKPSRDRKRAHVEVIDLCDDSPVKSSSPPPSSSSSSSSSILDASTPLSPFTTSLWETKLKAWVHRELEALLETEDLDLLLLVVRSLLERTCSSSSSSSSSSSATHRGARLTVGQVLGLRPHMEEFLFEHTQQFLHELALYWKSSDGGNKGWNDGGRSCSNSSIILE